MKDAIKKLGLKSNGEHSIWGCYRGRLLLQMLVLQRQIIKNPTPTLTLPLKGRGFYGVFSLHGGDFMGFSHFHGRFSNPSPFKGEVRRGTGYICRCSIKGEGRTINHNLFERREKWRAII